MKDSFEYLMNTMCPHGHDPDPDPDEPPKKDKK